MCVSEMDFVDAVRCLLVASVAKIVDKKYPDSGNGERRLAKSF